MPLHVRIPQKSGVETPETRDHGTPGRDQPALDATDVLHFRWLFYLKLNVLCKYIPCDSFN